MFRIEKRSGITGVAVFVFSMLAAASTVYRYAPAGLSNASEAADVNVSVRPVISLTVDTNLLNFSTTPSSEDTFYSLPVTATVDTNAISGYELYFSSADHRTDMTSKTSYTSMVLSSDFEGTVTSSTMGSNKWGFSLDNINFSKVPASSYAVLIRNIDSYPTTAEKNTTIYAGMKVSNTLDSGIYAKNVRFTALAHPNPYINRLSELTSMQDPNLAQYCKDTYTPSKNSTTRVFDRLFFDDLVPSATLSDLRDTNSYTISKLADGKCWMVQNLKIADAELTSALSDLEEGDSFTVLPSGLADPGYPNVTDTFDHVYIDPDYGGLYPWHTATAGSGTNDMISGNATSSICPKGWRLPVGGSDGDYRELYNYYSNRVAMMNAPGFTLNGYIYGTYRDRGRSAYYASSTAKSDFYLYTFYFSHDYLSVSGTDNTQENKHLSMAIHCIARD